MKSMSVLLVLLCATVSLAQRVSDADVKNWQARAQRVVITRDDFGIAHIAGQRDADAVFGAIYAQAEDDFSRVETNYLNALGRVSEVEGIGQIWRDLRVRLFVDPGELKKLYEKSPEWLKELMQAFAAGLNYYLYTHPKVHPRAITRFEPWMALAFTEGSIGGDLERIDLSALRCFYEKESCQTIAAQTRADPTGSNGVAIAPNKSVSGHALLLINPHTTFFFRSEQHMTSKEGLNAYGAATWGQFFIYQGFNERLGWMHTSSPVDAIDEYTFSKAAQFKKSDVRIKYKTKTGMKERVFTTYKTPRGPIVRQQNGAWIACRLMYDPIHALMQSFLRTKATSLASYKQAMALHANSSNNTIYADADGNIAFFYANFVPRRDPHFDWTKPVSGTDARTDWSGVLDYKELPNVENPSTGFVFNTNNWPWTSAGVASPKKSDYPRYIDQGTENARGQHALKMLQSATSFDLGTLTALAFDSYLTWFDDALAALSRAYDKIPKLDWRKSSLITPMRILVEWDKRFAFDSVATTIAVTWAEELLRKRDFTIENAPEDELLTALLNAMHILEHDFGTYQVPWGELNRLQRVSGEIDQQFNDDAPSIGVPFAPGNLGALASFAPLPNRKTKKRYGVRGNTFVAVVEFGKKVRARAVSVGGSSGNPSSKHFNDQSERYAKGDLRDVYFYPDELKGHFERVYRPGE